MFLKFNDIARFEFFTFLKFSVLVYPDQARGDHQVGFTAGSGEVKQFEQLIQLDVFVVFKPEFFHRF